MQVDPTSDFNCEIFSEMKGGGQHEKIHSSGGELGTWLTPLAEVNSSPDIESPLGFFFSYIFLSLRKYFYCLDIFGYTCSM